MNASAGCIKDWDDLIAALAAHALLARMFDADALGEAVGNVRHAAHRCGWDAGKGEVFAWAGRMAGRYRDLTAPRPRS